MLWPSKSACLSCAQMFDSWLLGGSNLIAQNTPKYLPLSFHQAPLQDAFQESLLTQPSDPRRWGSY